MSTIPVAASAAPAIAESTPDQRWDTWVRLGREQDRQLYRRAWLVGGAALLAVLTNVAYAIATR